MGKDKVKLIKPDKFRRSLQNPEIRDILREEVLRILHELTDPNGAFATDDNSRTRLTDTEHTDVGDTVHSTENNLLPLRQEDTTPDVQNFEPCPGNSDRIAKRGGRWDSFSMDGGQREKSQQATNGAASVRERLGDTTLREKEAEIRELQGEIKELEQENKQPEADRHNLAQSLRREIESLKEKYARAKKISEPFAELTRQHALYLQLPEKRRAELQNVIKADSPVAFVVTGSSQDTVLNLWDYMKEHLDDLSVEELNALGGVLQFMLDQYNSRWLRPVYRMMADEQGKPFDDERHSRGQECSVHQGMIEKTLLPGIWNLHKESAERKSVVYYS